MVVSKKSLKRKSPKKFRKLIRKRLKSPVKRYVSPTKLKIQSSNKLSRSLRKVHFKKTRKRRLNDLDGGGYYEDFISFIVGPIKPYESEEQYEKRLKDTQKQQQIEDREMKERMNKINRMNNEIIMIEDIKKENNILSLKDKNKSIERITVAQKQRDNAIQNKLLNEKLKFDQKKEIKNQNRLLAIKSAEEKIQKIEMNKAELLKLYEQDLIANKENAGLMARESLLDEYAFKYYKKKFKDLSPASRKYFGSDTELVKQRLREIR